VVEDAGLQETCAANRHCRCDYDVTAHRQVSWIIEAKRWGWTGVVPHPVLGKRYPRHTPTVLDSSFDTTKDGQRVSEWYTAQPPSDSKLLFAIIYNALVSSLTVGLHKKINKSLGILLYHTVRCKETAQITKYMYGNLLFDACVTFIRT
jgi:hypothetical protein